MSDGPRERLLLDAGQMRRVIRRMAGEVVEKNAGVEGLMLVGVRTRGVPLAERMAREIAAVEEVEVPLGTLDITLYRDDLSTVGPQPVVKRTSFPGAIQGRVVVLCDDVLFTGRTVRAALNELMDYGRPAAVRLAVLVDRGLRELPIHPDGVGLQVETSAGQSVGVAFEETDGREGVWLVEGVG